MPSSSTPSSSLLRSSMVAASDAETMTPSRRPFASLPLNRIAIGETPPTNNNNNTICKPSTTTTTPKVVVVTKQQQQQHSIATKMNQVSVDILDPATTQQQLESFTQQPTRRQQQHYSPGEEENQEFDDRHTIANYPASSSIFRKKNDCHHDMDDLWTLKRANPIQEESEEDDDDDLCHVYQGSPFKRQWNRNEQQQILFWNESVIHTSNINL